MKIIWFRIIFYCLSLEPASRAVLDRYINQDPARIQVQYIPCLPSSAGTVHKPGSRQDTGTVYTIYPASRAVLDRYINLDPARIQVQYILYTLPPEQGWTGT